MDNGDGIISHAHLICTYWGCHLCTLYMHSHCVLPESCNVSRHIWKAYPHFSPVSNLQALCGKNVQCHQQRIPIKAHPQWRGNTLPILSLYVSCVAKCNHHDIVCLFTLFPPASPAVTGGHSLTVHWLAWPRHSRGPPTIPKWASPSPDIPVILANSVTYASLLYTFAVHLKMYLKWVYLA